MLIDHRDNGNDEREGPYRNRADRGEPPSHVPASRGIPTTSTLTGSVSALTGSVSTLTGSADGVGCASGSTR